MCPAPRGPGRWPRSGRPCATSRWGPGRLDPGAGQLRGAGRGARRPAVPVPDGMELDVAAAVMLQGMTAHYLCHSTYPVGQGDQVVVHAAAGGVGLLLTQMIAMRGGVGRRHHVHHGQGGAGPAGGRGLRDGLRGLRRRGPAGDRRRRRGRGLRRRRPGHVRGEPGGAAPRGYMVLYGAASGPVPPFDLQRLNPAARCSSPGPTLAHYIATRDELLRRAGDLFGWITEGRLLGPRRRPVPAGRGGPGAGGPGRPADHRQAAAAAG